MTKVYNKLVRDKLPEIIEADGKIAKIHILNKQDYQKEVVKKLGEYYEQLKSAPDVKKLADMQEALLATAEAFNIPAGELAAVMAKKAVNKGAFKKRIFLESVE